MKKRIIISLMIALLILTLPFLIPKIMLEIMLRREPPETRQQYELWKITPVILPQAALHADPFTTDTAKAAFAFREIYNKLEKRTKEFVAPKAKDDLNFYDLISDPEFLSSRLDQLDQFTSLTMAFEHLVSQPDYQVEAEAIGFYGPDGHDFGGRMNSPPYLEFYPLRETAKIMALQTVRLIQEERLKEALDKADKIVRASKIDSYVNFICRMQSNSLFSLGISAWSQVLDHCDDRALLERMLREANSCMKQYPALPEKKYYDTLEAISGLRWLKRQGCTPPDYGRLKAPELIQLYYSLLAVYQEKCVLPYISNETSRTLELKALRENISLNRNMAFNFGPLKLTWKHIKSHPAAAITAIATHDAWRALFFNMPGTIYESAKETDNVPKIKLDLLRLKTARKLYRLREGREAPADVAALVPYYLPEVPTDPFSEAKQPFRFLNGTDYSIGTDKIDQKLQLLYDPSNGTITGGDLTLK